MRLAAVDRRCPALIRAATVAGVQSFRLKLHFDGWDSAYDYLVEDTSLDIFPYDFVLETGHDIEPPLELLTNCPATKTCSQAGCYGYGHISGALYSNHSQCALVKCGGLFLIRSQKDEQNTIIKYNIVINRIINLASYFTTKLLVYSCFHLWNIAYLLVQIWPLFVTF